MRINTNIAALRSCYQLNEADDRVTASLAKLTSGNKLINLKDNPVGASLSVKMKTQIRNLNRASQNTSDGISVIETAEGALAEIQSMVQRINELAVQGANESNTDEDRQSIMDEVNQIKEGIDRISSDTNFNTKTLLDGSISKRNYTNSQFADVSYASDGVEVGTYRLLYDDTATKAEISTGNLTSGSLPDGKIKLNGASVDIKSTDTLSEVYDKFIEAGQKTGVSVSYTGSLTGTAVFSFTQEEFGSNYSVDINTSDPMAAALGLSGADVSEVGADGTVAGLDTTSGFKSSAIATVSGKEITIKDNNGFEMKINVTEDTMLSSRLSLIAGITDVGAMSIQVGANEYQELDIDIPEVNSKTLGLDKIKTYTSKGCSEAITASQSAIAHISSIRSKIGAYQNRMEHTISALDVTEENMTSSLTRIEDVDIADEMTKYTTYNVMSQAATSMLAQANQLPEKVLQLLQ